MAKKTLNSTTTTKAEKAKTSQTTDLVTSQQAPVDEVSATPMVESKDALVDASVDPLADALADVEVAEEVGDALVDAIANSSSLKQGAEKADDPESMIASVEYVRGRRRGHIPVHELPGIRRDLTRLVWIALKNPSNEELELVCNQLGISSEVQEEIRPRHKKPRVVDYDEYVHVVAITFSKSKSKLNLGELQMIFGVGFVLTIRRGQQMNIARLRQRLEAFPELIARGSDYVAAEILDTIVDSYAVLSERYENEVNQTERHMLMETGFSQEDVVMLYKQRRELLRVHTTMAPTIEICRKLALVKTKVVEEDSRAYYTLVSDRIARIDEQINALREALAFAFEASMMIAQAEQTNITKKLASWAAILAVPTAVAGIYGMNFKFMPELDWPFAYPVLMGALGGFCVYLYRRFKRAGWLS